MPTRIMALDISSKGAAFACGDLRDVPDSGVEDLRSANRGLVAEKFRRWLRDLIILQGPDMIAFEAPLMNFAGPRSPDAARMLLGLAMVAEMVCALRHLRCEEVHVQTWRKSLLGTGRPDNPKRATMDACRALGWEIGNSDDRADACGVLMHAHLTWGNKSAARKLVSELEVAGMAR